MRTPKPKHSDPCRPHPTPLEIMRPVAQSEAGDRRSRPHCWAPWARAGPGCPCTTALDPKGAEAWTPSLSLATLV
jgi:hypothetical protein